MYSISQLPLALFRAGSSGLALDKDAIEDALGGVGTTVCNRVIRCTFPRSTPPHSSPGHGVAAREPGFPKKRVSRAILFCHWALGARAPDPAGDLDDGARLGHRPAVRSLKVRLLAHAPNIGESDVYEIVEKRQQSG